MRSPVNEIFTTSLLARPHLEQVLDSSRSAPSSPKKLFFKTCPQIGPKVKIVRFQTTFFEIRGLKSGSQYFLGRAILDLDFFCFYCRNGLLRGKRSHSQVPWRIRNTRPVSPSPNYRKTVILIIYCFNNTQHHFKIRVPSCRRTSSIVCGKMDISAAGRRASANSPATLMLSCADR